MLTIYFQGQTVSKYFYFKDKDADALTPNVLTCKVYDPTGTLDASPTLAEVVTGQYEMNYPLAADAAEGMWKIVVTGTVTGTTDFVGIEKWYFEVKPV